MAGHEATKEVLDDQEGIMHACEGETSMMMALKPDLVDHARLPEAHGPNLGPSGALQCPLHLSISFKSITPTGVIGDSRRATPAKGEAIIEACANGLAARLLKGEPWA